MTADNTALNLNIAANYGGRWDIVQAVNQHLQNNPGISQVSEQDISNRVQLHDEPPLDLLIRTGGEIRISNFLLWQAAYAELYFSDVLWPDFGPEALDKALAAYAQRQRRYGKTGEQVTGESAQGDA